MAQRKNKMAMVGANETHSPIVQRLKARDKAFVIAALNAFEKIEKYFVDECIKKIKWLSKNKIVPRELTIEEYNKFVIDTIEKTCKVYFQAEKQVFNIFTKLLFDQTPWVPECPKRLSFNKEIKNKLVAKLKEKTEESLKSQTYLLADEFDQITIVDEKK